MVKDLIGQRFGKLTVLKRDTDKKSKSAYWICQCDCGSPEKSIIGIKIKLKRSCFINGKFHKSATKRN